MLFKLGNSFSFGGLTSCFFAVNCFAKNFELSFKISFSPSGCIDATGTEAICILVHIPILTSILLYSSHLFPALKFVAHLALLIPYYVHSISDLGPTVNRFLSLFLLYFCNKINQMQILTLQVQWLLTPD